MPADLQAMFRLARADVERGGSPKVLLKWVFWRAYWEGERAKFDSFMTEYQADKRFTEECAKTELEAGRHGAILLEVQLLGSAIDASRTSLTEAVTWLGFIDGVIDTLRSRPVHARPLTMVEGGKRAAGGNAK